MAGATEIPQASQTKPSLRGMKFFLLSTVGQEAHFAGALDFTRQIALMSRAAASFFARQDLVLATDEAAQEFRVAQRHDIKPLGAKETAITALFFDRHN